HAPEATFEQIRPVHRIVLSLDVGGDAAEVEALRALPLRSDDALPEEDVRGMALSRRVVRRASLVDDPLATAPGHRPGDRHVVDVRETERGEARVDERAPDRLVVVVRPRDELRAPSRERIEVVEGTQPLVVAHLAHRDTSLWALPHAPARVLV